MHSHIGLDPIIIYGDHLNEESEWASVLWKNAIVETRDTKNALVMECYLDTSYKQNVASYSSPGHRPIFL